MVLSIKRERTVAFVGPLGVHRKGGFELYLEGDCLRSWRGKAFKIEVFLCKDIEGMTV